MLKIISCKYDLKEEDFAGTNACSRNVILWADDRMVDNWWLAQSQQRL